MAHVSLPWYEIPGTEALHDELWLCLRRQLDALAFPSPLPSALERGLGLDETLSRKDLLLTQTCGFDIAVKHPPLQLLGTLAYGGRPGTYTSYLVTKEGATQRVAKEFRGLGLAANDPRSYSGFHVWRQWIHGDPNSFFEEVRWTSSHLESLRGLKEGSSHAAAIDSVTFSLLRKFLPSSTEGIQILAESRPVPAPPLVTLRGRNQEEVEILQEAFFRLFQEESSRSLCKELQLSGFFLWREEDYRELLT